MNTIQIKMELPLDVIRSILRQELDAFYREKNQKNKEEQPEIMSFKQACQFLSCSASKLYKLTANRQIPHSKKGKTLYFERKEIVEWMLENRIKTKSEIQDVFIS